MRTYVRKSNVVPYSFGRPTTGGIAFTRLLYIKTVLGDPMNVAAIHHLTPSTLRLQFISGTAAGGFPNPAADYYQAPISLDDLLNIRAPHVFIVQVEGHSMTGAGILHGCRLVVDRTITPMSGHIVLAYVDNQPIVKRLLHEGGKWLLASEHPDFPPLVQTDFSEITTFGVVTWNFNQHAC